MKNFVHLVSYLVLRFIGVILLTLPLGFSYGLARVIGNFAYHVLGYRRQVVMQNLHIALGRERSEAELAHIAAESYQQIAMSFLELLLASKLKHQIQHMLKPEQKALFTSLLKQENGLVLVSGHLGSWELQGAACAAAMPNPITVAAAQQSNPYIDRFITHCRTELGMQMAGTKEAMKLLLKALKNREAIGLVADQNAGRDAVFVDFFGKSAATPPGPAQLALKYKAPLVVLVAIRLGTGKFITLAQQVEIKEDDTVESLTQRHVTILEGFIRRYPEQYMWLHRRWKTRPPGEIEDLKN